MLWMYFLSPLERFPKRPTLMKFWSISLTYFIPLRTVAPSNFWSFVTSLVLSASRRLKNWFWWYFFCLKLEDRLDILHTFFDRFNAQSPKAKKEVGLCEFEEINNPIMVSINVNHKEHFLKWFEEIYLRTN